VIAFFSELDPAPALTMHDRTNSTPPDNPGPGNAPPAVPFAKTLSTRYFQLFFGSEQALDVKSNSSPEGPGVEINLPCGTWSFTTPEAIDAFASVLKQALAVDPFPEMTRSNASQRDGKPKRINGEPPPPAQEGGK
jgi:hypothetical protein